MSDGNDAKRQQFVELMPLTLALAGLPPADHGKYFNEDQIELRARNLLLAYRQAKTLVREATADSE